MPMEPSTLDKSDDPPSQQLTMPPSPGNPDPHPEAIARRKPRDWLTAGGHGQSGGAADGPESGAH
jgi:hypothetical protein